MCAGRRHLGIVAALGLTLSAACAHGRQTSRGLSPTTPPRQVGSASSDASRRTPDTINPVREQFGPANHRPHSGDNPGQPVGQLGSGSDRSASTTGVVPQPTVSGGGAASFRKRLVRHRTRQCQPRDNCMDRLRPSGAWIARRCGRRSSRAFWWRRFSGCHGAFINSAGGRSPYRIGGSSCRAGARSHRC